MGVADDLDPPVGREQRLERLREEAMVVRDQDADLALVLRGCGWHRGLPGSTRYAPPPWTQKMPENGYKSYSLLVITA